MDDYLQLVKQAKKGDIDAFAELYKEVYKGLYKFALYTLKNKEDAEDVVSDTVADAFASIKRLRAEEAFQSWIFRILTNKCKRKLKEYMHKNEELREDVPELLKESELAESIFVRNTFFELSQEERLIISMHVFGGYTNREIAGILRMNENTIRSKASRALKKMEKKLKQ